MSKKGQIGVEFFLVMGFSLTVIALLISNSEKQLTQNEILDSAILSTSAMNAVSNAANLAFLQGNGSLMRVNVFIPGSTRCFLQRPLTSGRYALACDVGEKGANPRKAYGMELQTQIATISDSCYTISGWMDVTVNSSGLALPNGPIGIYCKQQA